MTCRRTLGSSAATLRTLAAGAAGSSIPAVNGPATMSRPCPTRDPLRRTELAARRPRHRPDATACGSTPPPSAHRLRRPRRPRSRPPRLIARPTRPRRPPYLAARPSARAAGDPQAHDDQHGLGRHPRRRPRRLPRYRTPRTPRRTSRSAPPSSPTRPTSTPSRAGIATRWSRRLCHHRPVGPARGRVAGLDRRPTCPSARSRRPSGRRADRR